MRMFPDFPLISAKMAGLFALGCLSVLGLSAPAAEAQELLPLARDRAMATLVQPRTSAPFATGARVEIMAPDRKGIPRRLTNDAVVLGSLDGVVFLEVDPRHAAYLARIRESQAIKLQKTFDPDPELLAQRQEAGANPFVVAPHMHSFTVSVVSTAETIANLKTGAKVSLSRHTAADGNLAPISGSFAFLGASETQDGLFDVTLAAQGHTAFAAMEAGANGTLSMSVEGAPFVLKKRQCSIRQMHGGQTRRIAIPCGSTLSRFP